MQLKGIRIHRTWVIGCLVEPGAVGPPVTLSPHAQESWQVSVKVFISWSKDLSWGYGLLLQEWLAEVLHQIEPWISSEDISKGQRWSMEIFQQLDAIHLGIVCVTRENMAEPWLNFESGALAKSLTHARVWPILIDLPTADLLGPLALFQATVAERRDDMLKLVRSMNDLCPLPLDRQRLERSFERTWPEFEDKVKSLVVDAPTGNPAPPAPAGERQYAEILAEVLEHVRELRRVSTDRDIRPQVAIEKLVVAPEHGGDGPAPRTGDQSKAAEEALAALRERLRLGEAQP